MAREALWQEAMALVVRPYESLEGMLGRADELFERATDLGDERLAMLGRLSRADVLNRRQRLAEGMRLNQQVLRWANEAHDDLVIARANALIGTGLWRLGAWAEAVPHAELAVNMLPADAPLALRADHALTHAMLNGLRADAPDPVLFGRADELTRELADPVLIVANLNNLAWFEYAAGRVDRAGAAVEELRSIAERAGIRLTATTLDTVALVLLEQGRITEADRLLTGALIGDVAMTEADAEATLLMTYSELKLRAGRLEEALETVFECQELIAGKGLGETEAIALHKLATVRAAMGQYQQAYQAMVDFTAKRDALRSRQAEATASVLKVMVELDQARRDSERYQELAERDALTGLWNRRYLDRVLPGLLEDPGRGLAIALVDLDHFKGINDRFSHDVGDAVLRVVGGMLTECGDFAVRMGGEEFLLVFTGAGYESVVAACERLRRRLQAFDWSACAPGLAVTTSIGVTAVLAGDGVPTLLRRADEHLYRSKRDGRNRVTPDRAVTAQVSAKDRLLW